MQTKLSPVTGGCIDDVPAYLSILASVFGVGLRLLEGRSACLVNPLVPRLPIYLYSQIFRHSGNAPETRY